MEIKFDTSIMRIMANKALNARNAMETAMKTADAVTLHNDWNCAERDLIDDGITEIKKKNNVICENMALYSDKINSLAMQVDDFDKSLLARFSNVDSSVGEMYQIESGVVTNNSSVIGAGEVKRISSNLAENTYWNQYHVGNLTQPIPVVNFSDANDILSGAESTVSQADVVKDLAGKLGIDEYIGG
ncbi:MAG: hypothetical protein IK106_01855 [Clostridiales bacterium]|nr:hypothetical protein [Clostridiales bacterium]MBR6253903.1 hypothetical protein [Clostridiales bacterium]